MDIAVIVAIIGACGSIAGSLVGYMTASKVSEYRIEQLEKKVDDFSHKVDMLYELSQQNAVQNEKIMQNTQDIILLNNRVIKLEANQ